MQVFYCSIAHFSEGDGLCYLPEYRLQKIQRYIKHEDRMRSLVAGLMLRAVLGEMAQENPLFSPMGKPYYAHAPSFNLSHAGQYVALAVATKEEQEVGVDIEELASGPVSFMDLAKKCFTVREIQWLEEKSSSADNDAVMEAFFAIWTAKESIMKASGLGFHLSPASFDVLESVKNTYKPCFAVEKTWYLNRKSFENYTICTASNCIPSEPEFIFLSREDIFLKLQG